MRVLVVDDHPLFREGLRAMIERMRPDARVIECGSCEDAIAVASEDALELDLVLLDVALPGMNGLDGIALFRERFVTTPVVVISGSYEPRQVKQAIDRGAQGFIPKSTPPELLASALRFIFAGGVYVPPDVLNAPPHETASPAQPAGVLTTAQSRVLALMVRGQSNKSIAQALHISDNTVRAHVSAILRALGATNRTEAVAAAINGGLTAHDA
jgi:DNA-binding NarL/FixJ family response regulator